MTVTLEQLEAMAISHPNDVVRNAALSLVEIARASPNPDILGNALDRIGTMFSLPATGQGTAIFFSGILNGRENKENAIDVRNHVLGGDGYLWFDTPLGQYIDTFVTLFHEASGWLPVGIWSAASNYMSARMAAEAVGPAIACVAGVPPTGYSAWLAQELPATSAGSGISSFNGVPVSLVIATDPVTASQMISQVYDCTTGERIPDPVFAAAVLGLPAPEPGLESPLLPSILLGGALVGAGTVIAGGIRLAGQAIGAVTEGASGYATTAAGNVLRFFGVTTSDGTSGGIASILSTSLSGLAGLVPQTLAGTAFEHFLPSTLLASNGGLDIDWDWSTVSFSEASLAVPVQGGSFDYITVPGISVVDATGNFTGTFAQTSDGIPIFQIAADSYGITQTAFPTDGGGVKVITNNGSVTGQFDFSGPVGTTADPFTYFGNTANLQLQDLKFTDNSTSEVIGQGKYIKGGNTKTGGDAVVAQVRSATTGVWQTTVTVNRPEPGLTPEQQEALIRQAIADIIAGDGLVVDADGTIAHVTGTLLRATDAGSDATWIEPDPIATGGVLMRTAPVLGWRTYNFTVEGLHTYVAANDNTSPEVSRAA